MRSREAVSSRVRAAAHPNQKKKRPSQRVASLVPLRTLMVLFLYRVGIAFTLRTAESPDEWWQSAEVAYFMAFGRGHLTWEWREGIRSVVFPAMYALPYFLLKSLRLDNAYTVYFAERFVQACIATGIDASMVALSGVIDRAVEKDAREDRRAAANARHEEGSVTLQVDAVDGREEDQADGDPSARQRQQHRDVWGASPSVAQTTMCLAMTHWYLTYDGARSYSNVAEGFSVMLAVVCENYLGFLVIAGVACMVRVTAVMALLPIFGHHVRREVQRRGVASGLCSCLAKAVVVAGAAVGLMMSVDFVFYRRWIVTPLRFLDFNIIKNVSQFFGVYPWWWYFVVGFPVMLGPHLLLLLLLPLATRRLSLQGREARRTCGIVWRLVGLLVWTLSANSAVAHKEVRFMFPMLPVALVLVSFVVSIFVRLPSQTRVPSLRRGRHHGGDGFPKGDSIRTGSDIVRSSHVVLLHKLFLLVNVILIVILGYVYRQGAVGVIAAIRRAPVDSFDRVDILTHCYFTPGYSQLHGKVRELRLIDCPVQLDSKTGERLITDDILFRQFPAEYLYWLYRRQLPPGLGPSLTTSAAFTGWLAEMQKRLPQGESVVLPDAIVVFEGVSDARSADFFVKSGYVRYKRVFHAPKSFEPDEDPYVDLWVKDSHLRQRSTSVTVTEEREGEAKGRTGE